MVSEKRYGNVRIEKTLPFWFVTIALCKIGAIMIPATNQLTKDYVSL